MSDNAWENVVVESDVENFTKIRKGFGKQGDVAELLGLSGQVLLSQIENGVSGMDKRTYSLFLLLTGKHPSYRLVGRSNDGSVVDMSELVQEVPTNSGEVIKTLRKGILRNTGKSITQGRFASLLGLTDKGAISCFENGKTKPSKQNYTLMLLLADKHPHFFLTDRNEADGLLFSENMVESLSPISIEIKIISEQDKVLVITNATNAKQINAFLSKNDRRGYILVDNKKVQFESCDMWSSFPGEYENEYKSSFYIFTFNIEKRN